MLADLYIDDKAYAKAARLLETGFRLNPHQEITSRLKLAWKSNDGQFIGRLVKLLGKVDKEQRWTAYTLIAEQAHAVGMDGEARRILDEAESVGKTSDFRARDTLSIWQCVTCRSLHEDWQAFCPACGEFSALSWQRPSGVTPMIQRT